MSDNSLRCRDLDVAIGNLNLVSALNLEIEAGEFVCVIGCNGAGKSTLMHTLAGLRNGTNGNIDLMDKSLALLTRTEIAKNVGLLPQQHEDAFPATVQETVLLGRHPHLGFWEWESANDLRIAADALSSMGISELAHRDIATLSGGERQRVALATVLAQRPGLYLLDEPLNNLDPHHQLTVLLWFRKLCTLGVSTIAVLHDLNLVSRFADKVLLLYGPAEDSAWLYGSVDECMTADNLTRLYKTTIHRFTHDGRTLFVAA